MVAACMHLTMVLEQREDIKQATMKGLSVDDQLVVKTILHAIVDEDRVTGQRLAEILRDEPAEPVLERSRPCTFYTSSPASSAGSRSSPLKRYLDASSPPNKLLINP